MGIECQGKVSKTPTGPTRRPQGSTNLWFEINSIRMC
jgi:hypothetical protein